MGRPAIHLRRCFSKVSRSSYIGPIIPSSSLCRPRVPRGGLELRRSYFPRSCRSGGQLSISLPQHLGPVRRVEAVRILVWGVLSFLWQKQILHKEYPAISEPGCDEKGEYFKVICREQRCRQLEDRPTEATFNPAWHLWGPPSLSVCSK